MGRPEGKPWIDRADFIMRPQRRKSRSRRAACRRVLDAAALSPVTDELVLMRKDGGKRPAGAGTIACNHVVLPDFISPGAAPPRGYQLSRCAA